MKWRESPSTSSISTKTKKFLSLLSMNFCKLNLKRNQMQVRPGKPCMMWETNLKFQDRPPKSWLLSLIPSSQSWSLWELSRLHSTHWRCWLSTTSTTWPSTWTNRMMGSFRSLNSVLQLTMPSQLTRLWRARIWALLAEATNGHETEKFKLFYYKNI